MIKVIQSGQCQPKLGLDTSHPLATGAAKGPLPKEKYQRLLNDFIWGSTVDIPITLTQAIIGKTNALFTSLN
jgi:hypothetical protein